RRTHCTLSYSSAHPPPLASFPTRRSSDLEGQVQHVAPRFRSIADAVDLEDAREALVDAVDHVADELPREPMDAARPTRVVAPADDHGPALDGDADLRIEAALERTPGTLDA